MRLEIGNEYPISLLIVWLTSNTRLSRQFAKEKRLSERCSNLMKYWFPVLNFHTNIFYKWTIFSVVWFLYKECLLIMLHLEKLFYSVPQRMSVCGFCLSYTLPWDLGLFCCIPTFVFLNIVCGGNFHLSRQQMWMRTKFSNRCRIRRWPNRLPFYSSNNSGHWASVGYTWYGFTNIIRHQLFVRQYKLYHT